MGRVGLLNIVTRVYDINENLHVLHMFLSVVQENEPTSFFTSLERTLVNSFITKGSSKLLSDS